MTTIVSKSTEESAEIAGKLAKKIASVTKGPVIVALSGELGAGKTFFVSSLCRVLGIVGNISSPTFTLINRYDIKPPLSPSGITQLYHCDFYRLKHVHELEVLGFETILKDEKALILIEWPELVKDILPESAIHLAFAHGDAENERLLTMPDNLME